jgi:serine/threonine protein phosphatase PrpC
MGTYLVHLLFHSITTNRTDNNNNNNNKGSSKTTTINNNNNKLTTLFANHGDPQLQSFPYHPHPRMITTPTTTTDTTSSLRKGGSLVREWQEWAKEPIVGSFSFSPTKSNINLYHSIIHFPVIDLEHIYQETNPTDTTTDSALSSSSSSLSLSKNGALLTAARPSSGFDDRSLSDFVVMTRKGNKYTQGEIHSEEMDTSASGGGKNNNHRQPNQDRVVLLSREPVAHHSRSHHHKDDFWIGLFDGHGPHGECISQYCSLEFAKQIQQEWERESPRTLLEESVVATIQQMYVGINRHVPYLYASGSTGISIWRRGDFLYMSNVGDSLAFVATYEKLPTTTDGASGIPTKVEIIYSTKAHKPNLPEEQKRIEQAGGQVEHTPFEGASARLLIPMKDGSDVFALAMSRSLGDQDGEPYGLIAEPTTDVLDLGKLKQDREYFVVAVTDGLVDYGRISPMEVAQRMAVALEEHNAQKMTEAAEELVLKSSRLWQEDPFGNGYRDDISIVVRRLRFP